MRELGRWVFAIGATLLSCFHASADDRNFVLVTGVSDPSFQEELKRGCQDVVDDSSISCTVLFSDSSVERTAVELSDFLAADRLAGVAVEGNLRGLEGALAEIGGGAGVPVVAFSTSTPTGAEPLAELAQTTVAGNAGDMANSAVSTLNERLSDSMGEKPAACVVGFSLIDGQPNTLATAIAGALKEAGFAVPDECPTKLQSFAELEDKIPGLVIDRKVSAIILPDFLSNSGFNALEEVAGKLQTPMTIMSIAPSPRAIGSASAAALLKLLKGEKTEKVQDVPSSIQVSTTDAFCSKCDCSTDSTCKRECRKCQ